MAYTYVLSYLSRSKTIEPVSIGKINVAKEDGEAFFREKMSGSLVLSGDDYEFVFQGQQFGYQCCQKFDLSINKSCGTGVSSLFWAGTFTMADISWDHDNRTATVKKVSVSDRYSLILMNWHKEINWLDILTKLNQPLWMKASYFQTTPKTADYNPLGRYEHFRAMPFIIAIQWLVNQTMIGTSQEGMADGEYPGEFLSFSTFLGAETNPVTNKPNYLKYILLEHISEAVRPNASNPAEKGIVSLKQLLAELKIMFNAYWHIDEVGKFHIEHISFFPHLSYLPVPTTLDLTAPSFKETMRGLNRYDFQQEKLKGIEGITFSINESSYSSESEYYPERKQDPSIQDFNGAYMTFADTCSPKDDKGEKIQEIRSVNMFTTDFYGVTFKPDTMPKQGWYLVHVPYYTNMDGIVEGWSPISGKKFKNGCLSPGRLYYDFGRYESSFIAGMFSSQPDRPKEILTEQAQITERPLRTKTVKAIKAFAPIELDLCCGMSYNFSGYIKHPSAEKCVLEQLEYDLITQSVTLTIIGIDTCTDSSFPGEYIEDEAPSTGCTVKGVLLRTETITIVTNFGWTIRTMTDFFADGTCGEYTSIRSDSFITNQ